MRGRSRSGTMPDQSELDQLIPPEISGDRFWSWIERVAATPGVRHILEIGASAGAGSTEALVAGARRNPRPPTIHCLEVSRPRFAALRDRYADVGFVRCYNLSSVPATRFPTPEEIDAFRRRVWTRFRFIPRRTVLRWLRQDIEYLERHGLSAEGIRQVRESNHIDVFDAVVIDGSEFTGPADLAEVYGARFLLLDDIRTYKNHDNEKRLRRDESYRRLVRSRRPRNGFAVYGLADSTDVAEVRS